MTQSNNRSGLNLHSRRRVMAALCSGLALSAGGVLVAPGAMAQAYPNKPIRFIVPNPPGGGTDAIARAIANQMRETLQWQVVVDNRAGAGGGVGLDLAAKSPADGYTIVLGESSNLAINPALYNKLPYDSIKDFQPVILIGYVPLVLVVSTKAPYQSLADVITAAKLKPLSMASSGNGTVGHLVGEMLKKRAGVEMLHVPYKGAAPAITDLLGGQVDIYFASLPSAVSHIKNGSLRALAVTTVARASSLPEVPAIAESGYREFDASAWYGILAPAGTSESIVSRLNADIMRVMQLPQMRARFLTDGVEVLGGAPERFGSFIATERTKWAEVVKSSGAKID